MRKYRKVIIITSIFLFSFACKTPSGSENESCCKSKLLKKGFEYYKTRTIGKEYQSLKKKGDKCCEEYYSGLHMLMLELEMRLNNAAHDTALIIKYMGSPDARAVPKQYGNFIEGDEKIFVYMWRNWHDFLYFISENGKVKSVQFYHAYE
jgi:hypothetical protein